MNCPYCDNPVSGNVDTCPSCGARLEQKNTTPAPSQPDGHVEKKSKSRWMSVTSLVLGILFFLIALGFTEEENIDENTALGWLVMGILTVVFGAVAIFQKQPGRGMAIAGVILVIFTLIFI